MVLQIPGGDAFATGAIRYDKEQTQLKLRNAEHHAL